MLRLRPRLRREQVHESEIVGLRFCSLPFLPGIAIVL
jgi:hypothetical protein